MSREKYFNKRRAGFTSRGGKDGDTMADGSIIISTEIDADSFYDSLALLEVSLNSFVSRFKLSMLSSSSFMRSSMISAVNSVSNAVKNHDWEAAGSGVMAGIASGIFKNRYLVSDMLDSILNVTVSSALDRYASEAAKTAANYTQNIYLRDSESSPYQVARQIRRQSEDMIKI